MPMVPETFGPSVAQGATPAVPATGPWVSPMRNHAPAQMEQTADALARAGATESHLGNTIGDQIQQTFDDGNTRNAETTFLKAATGITTRYTHSLGKDALDGYEPAKQDLDKASEDAKAGLTNDLQRHMFALTVQPHLINFGKQISDHQYQQNIQFGTQAANDRSDSLIQLAANGYSDWQRPDGAFARNKILATREALKAAALLGQPEDSPQAQALVKQKTTALAQGVLIRMSNNEQYPEAKQYLDKALAAGEIDERAAESLIGMVEEGHNSQKANQLANEGRQVALGGSQSAAQQRQQPVAGGLVTSTLGEPRVGNRVHDGIDISIPVGTSVKAPANGTVSKVWNDEKFGGGLSMEITYPNGQVEGFAHLSAANYQPGQKVTQGAVVALTGKSGNATGPVLHWAMKDADGNWIDPRSAVPAPKNTDSFTDPDMLQKGIDYINSTSSTDRVKNGAISKLRSQYDTAREMDNQRYQKVKQQATDYYFANGGSFDGAPAEIRAGLKSQDLAAFESRPDKTKNDVDTLYGFITNPESLTIPNVKAAYAQGKLSDSGYLEWTQRAQKQENSEEKVRAASINTKQFTDILAANQLPDLALPKDNGQKLQRIHLENTVKDEIDVLQQKAGRQLTRDEKAKVMRDLVVDKVYTPGWFTAGAAKPVALLTPDEMKTATVYVAGQKVKLADIPAQYQQQATTELRQVGAAPTQANVAAWWIRKGKPRQ